VLHIAYRQNGKGRSGHRLKDLFTSVTLSEALGSADPAYDESWAGVVLFDPKNVKAALRPRRDDYQFVFELRPDCDHWGGIGPEKFRALKRLLSSAMASKVPVLLVLSGVFRLHLSQLHSWGIRGWVEGGAFARALSTLRLMYWGGAGPPTPGQEVRRVAIHARRGDVGNPEHRSYHQLGPGTIWTARFYESVIEHLSSSYPDASIEVFTEKSFSDDLVGLKGADLVRGGAESLEDHFRRMVTADILVPANSGLSTWAAYLSTGRVHVYNHQNIKHFNHTEYPANFEVIS